MIKKIRVLVVDDSTVIRRLLTDALSSDPGIEVAATAANGKIALAKIPQVNPDVITLDMEMPEMDGITTLVELRKLYPKTPVIMFSTLTQRGAEATLDALARGANDYVTKPANVGSVGQAILTVKNELCPKIKAFCPWAAPPQPALPPRKATHTSTAGNAHALNFTNIRNKKIDAIVIGVSTGGPNALQSVIPKLPADLPVPIAIVQHMPPIFTKHLADRLNSLSALTVQEATAGEEFKPGGVWVAPGDYHLTLRRDGTKIRTALDQGIPENSCRPAVDVLFRSAAAIFGANVLGVVLTGMGQDGARGSREIRSVGGRVLAQDEATSVVWGMPGAVVQAGEADKILPLCKVAEEIVRECSVGRRISALSGVGD